MARSIDLIYTEPTLSGGELVGKEPTIGYFGTEDRPIGRILIDMGRLKASDIPRVVDYQRRRDLRFGDAACTLRMVSNEDVRYALSVQFDYPYVGGNGSITSELVVAHQPFTDQAEVFRDLRTHLLLHWFTGGQRILSILSPDAQDGRSYLAANLAVAFAQLGEKTLLVDADLRFPRQHRIFGMDNSSGLSNILSGRAGVEAAVVVPHFKDLCVVTGGSVPPNPLELLARPLLRSVLDQFEQTFSVIIIDTPAGGRGSDARLVAARTGGSLLVARRNRTRLKALHKLQRNVELDGATVVGTVLNAA
jgi:chain length determinant protein tyrosine kinase EpsG